MRFLRTNTAVLVTVGPFFDKTDGVTIETGLTITNERITLTADTDDGSAPTNILDNVTGATSGTDNDLNYITGNDAGMMQLELSAANTNRLGRMMLSITDAANHVPVFHEFMVLPAMIYDAFVLGTDRFDTNVTHVADTAQTAGDIIADTNDIQTRLPAALVSGRIDASVGAMAANVMTAAAAASDLTTELQSGLATASALTTVAGYIDTEVAAILSAVDTEVAAIKAVVDDILVDTAEIGAAGAGLTALATQASVDTIDDFLDTEIAAIKAKTDNLPSDPADASDISSAFSTVNSTLGTIAGYVDTEVGAIKAVTDKLDTAIELDGSVYRLTTNALELAPTGGGGGLDAAGVRAAIGLASANLDTQLDALPTNAELSTALGTADDAILTQVALVKAKTDLIPASPAAVGDIPTAAALADAVWDEVLSGHVGVGSAGAAMAAAGNAGDPWSTPLPGAYGVGTAGHIIGNFEAAAGAGAIEWDYTLTSTVDSSPIADADVWVTSDSAGTNVLASGRTNQSGVVTFYLDAGTVYVWRQKSGFNFTNPQSQTVAA